MESNMLTEIQILKIKLRAEKDLMNQHKEGFDKMWLGNNYLYHKKQKEYIEDEILKLKITGHVRRQKV